MDVPGVLSRNVADCRAAFGICTDIYTVKMNVNFNVILFKIKDIIKGWDPKDTTTLQRPLSKSKLPDGSDSLDGLCVGIPKEFHCPGLSSEVVEVWNNVADLLEKSGARVVQVIFPQKFYTSLKTQTSLDFGIGLSSAYFLLNCLLFCSKFC